MTSNHEAIVKLSGVSNIKKVIVNIDSEIKRHLKFAKNDYDCNWSESIDIGNKIYVDNFKNGLALLGSPRNIENESETYSLKEDKSQ